MQASNIDTLRLGISVMVLGYIGRQKFVYGVFN